jgi:hypothetical protein
MIVRQDLLDEDDMRTSSMPKMLAGEIRRRYLALQFRVCVCICTCVCVYNNIM